MYELRMKRKLKKGLFLVSGFWFLVSISSAQNVKDSSLFVPMVKLSYSLQGPGGDLVDRFGTNSNVGLNFTIKTTSHWIIGAGGSFIFGNRIKEKGILDNLKTSSGFIINQNGNPAEVRLFERGYTVSIYAGRQFHWLGINKNSGIFAYAGPVFLIHKIKIDDIGHQSPPLVDPYPKGYDRLTAGFGAQQFVGYLFLSSKKMLNFFVGCEFTEAFTKSQRSFDYDLMKQDTKKRIDVLQGIRIGWILPLYQKPAQEFYYH